LQADEKLQMGSFKKHLQSSCRAGTPIPAKYVTSVEKAFQGGNRRSRPTARISKQTNLNPLPMKTSIACRGCQMAAVPAQQKTGGFLGRRVSGCSLIP
jgi:hypothetical protein